MKDRNVILRLWLYKPCNSVNGFDFKCDITNDCNNRTQSIEKRHPWDCNNFELPLFKSTELWNIETLTVIVKLYITEIDGHAKFFE